MMSSELAYIKITAPPGIAKACASGHKRLDLSGSDELMERLTPEHWAEFTRDTLTMAGDRVPEAARHEEEWAIEILMERNTAAAKLMAIQFKQTLGAIIENNSKDLASSYQGDKDCFYLEYDPAEWFTNSHPAAPGHRPFNHFLSGRLFALAWTGVLEAYGFTVEGTGLEEPEA